MNIRPLLSTALAFFLGFCLGMAEETAPELLAKKQELARINQRVKTPVLQDYLRALEALKQQYTSENNIPHAISVVAEIKRITAQVDLAARQIVIISATYGQHSRNKVVDIAQPLQAAVVRLDPSVVIGFHGLAERVDPAHGINKKIVITYLLNGQRKEKTFEDDHLLLLPQDLE